MFIPGYGWKVLLVLTLLKSNNIIGSEARVFASISFEAEEGCAIALNDTFPKPQPLILEPGTSNFLYPASKGELKISAGQTVELLCTNSFKKPFSGKKLFATCLLEDVFAVDNKPERFKEFSCKKDADHIARRTGKKCNHGKATEIEVGFDVDDRFLSVYEVCHDELTEATLYVHHKLAPENVAYQSQVERPRFIEGGFYNGKNVDRLYTKVSQMATIGDILGGGHDIYFNESMSLYLARGHLAAKVDMIYGSQQRATFYFINVAPQWQRFNAGNWERVETGVRNFVAKRNIQVDCYTGTYGIMELPDINGDYKKLYLYVDDDDGSLIPVPKIYFRIVYEPATKLGIVLIGVNNPHLTYEQLANDYIVCDDISDRINWISWDKDNILSGYSYACEVEQFTKAVNYFDDFEINGILL